MNPLTSIKSATPLLLAACLSAAWPAAAQPGDARAQGRAIMVEANARGDGYGDFRAGMEMLLRNAHGQESRREMRSRALEKKGGDWNLIIFDEPKDVAGTALLTHSHAGADDDQWLYLPALKRVKRIASGNKSGPFVGSEFAYEDLSSQEVEDYKDYKLLREEACPGGDEQCWVVERIPVDKDSGYSRQIGWADQSEYRLRKVDFYDRKGDPLKTLTFDDYRLYLDDYWYAHEMRMVNHQTGKSTVLRWKEYAFRNDYTDRDFDRNALQRVR
jgi:outer membrane lipoprotein-sorting protein